MKRLSVWIAFPAAVVLAAPSTQSLAQEGEAHALPTNDQCVVCHRELEGELAQPVTLFTRDVHLAAGLGCADCHGGDRTKEDADESMDPKKGYVGAPDALAIPKFCDRCHGDAAYMKKYNPGLPVDQYVKYLTSVHGTLNKAGDTKPAQCASCHPAHNMKPADDPTSSIYPLNIPQTCGSCHADSAYMAGYNIPTDQFSGYTTSIHGIALLQRHDLGAPACNDCHGNHAASPPITAAIANVCGNCHAFNAELFAQSPHKPAFEAQGIPACETCHGAHKIEQLSSLHLGGAEPSVCLNCHASDDGTRGIPVAVSMKTDLDSLDQAYEFADSLLGAADRKGMYVTDAEFELQDARQARIQAHTLVHAFSDTLVAAKVDSGLAIVATVAQTAHEKLEESSFRRYGLAISTLIISFLALMLFLKIRQIEK
jgi:hypothetical protein